MSIVKTWHEKCAIELDTRFNRKVSQDLEIDSKLETDFELIELNLVNLKFLGFSCRIVLKGTAGFHRKFV